MTKHLVIVLSCCFLVLFIFACGQVDTPTATNQSQLIAQQLQANSTDQTLISPVRITYIFYDGVQGSAEPDEYVQIKNFSGSKVILTGWTLRDKANHVFHFPTGFSMVSGKICRVYTNKLVPLYCNLDYHSGSAIWNNTGTYPKDCGYLRNASGVLQSQYCY